MLGGHAEPANTAEPHKHSFLKYTPTFSNNRIDKMKQRVLHLESLKLADSGTSVKVVKYHFNTLCFSQHFFWELKGEKGKARGINLCLSVFS